MADEKFSNFLTEIIDADLAEGKISEIHTRFPPEPNGYLHIGHAKALAIDFTMAEKFGGSCNLRYDDTNPTKEDEEFVDAIQEDIAWLGFHWDNVFYGSDYFDQCYELAVKLIKKGVAYVCDLSKDEMREYRGTLTEPGRNSPWRDRSVEENLDLFQRMKDGEFPDGSRTLRAKIDMASPNLNMRDPAMYRIIHMTHHHQGDKWCIYPMYDFAHPIQDAIEGITHSMCSLEFENHRPLYNWVIENIFGAEFPKQREFARLNMTNTVMSKRYLRELVEMGIVDGWDDPRMPTLCGLRRRGYTPTSIFTFVREAGISKSDNLIDMRQLEACIRSELDLTAQRRIAVLEPVKLVVDNYPADKTEYFDVANNPNREANDTTTRKVAFTKELWIENEDFAEVPPPKFKRLTVDGDAIGEAKNVEVVIGTPIGDVLDFCGVKDDVSKILMGGPMMGTAVADPAFPVLKQNNALVAFGPAAAALPAPGPCIRCGNCINACPMGLSPVEIAGAYTKNDGEMLDKLMVDLCIGCGTCSYVCPAKRPVTQTMNLAKAVWQKNKNGGKK